MYSNKENINILTSLLVAHGIRHAVVCPGSRNAPIVHNLNECPSITCYPVTDERSAGFYALGMAQATNRPVAVCVTSGTALLNLAPAVAEAAYQNRSIIVISADRPKAWIDQLDGQTLPQQDAFGGMVGMSINVAEPHDDEERWHCNRLINEALLATGRHGHKPVHINVPISEPLYDFSVAALPEERTVAYIAPQMSTVARSILLDSFKRAQRPMIVIGQTDKFAFTASLLALVNSCNVVVLQESLSSNSANKHVDEAISKIADDDSFLPDFILYVGGTLVSKRLKQFLRRAKTAECWIANQGGDVHDTFMNLTGVIECNPDDLVNGIADLIRNVDSAFYHKWKALLDAANVHCSDFIPGYSQMSAVKLFEEESKRLFTDYDFRPVHYANSMSVRLGCIYSSRFVYCNRGVNGIEGSLSTAAGYSLVADSNVYCVVGDLSFFYDANALWNRNLRGNLRILLLNNGCGGIFGKFEGLRQSAARDELVMAGHDATAEGVCMQNRLTYMEVHDNNSLADAIDTLLCMESERPVVLEVFTDAEEDMNVLNEYYKTL